MTGSCTASIAYADVRLEALVATTALTSPPARRIPVVASPDSRWVASWILCGTIWPIRALSELGADGLQHLLPLLSVRANVTFNKGAIVAVFKLT